MLYHAAHASPVTEVEWSFTTEVRFVRFGRIAAESDELGLSAAMLVYGDATERAIPERR